MESNPESDLQRALMEILMHDPNENQVTRIVFEELACKVACFESEVDSYRVKIEELTETKYELQQILESKDAKIASQWSMICMLRSELDWAMQKTKQEERKAQELAHQLDLANEKVEQEGRRAQELEYQLDLAKTKTDRVERRAQELENQLYLAKKISEHEEKRSQELNILLDEERSLRIQTENENAHKLYAEYTFEELRQATDHFDERKKLCEDGYGVVYKGKLHGMDVAVKHVTHGIQEQKQFQTEVELLSRIHHPQVVLLLGACPQRPCIVYEYMSNGSLLDRLNCKCGSPPLPWSVRLRICSEIAAGLLFLHCHEPPIILGDLKPASIWLDQNNVSKISDLGIAKLLGSNITQATAAMTVGTSAYMDPEYLRTGVLTCASDVYALGIIMLQLLTGRSPRQICDKVDRAFDKDHGFEKILDKSAGEWPLAEAMELGQLGLQCAESSPSDRPNLEEVLDILKKIRECAHEATTEALTTTTSRTDVPSCFYCPIWKEIMTNPCIAEDGFTYEHDIIEQWLQNHDTSPMTNLKLGNKRLTANRSVKSAIQAWIERGLISNL